MAPLARATALVVSAALSIGCGPGERDLCEGVSCRAGEACDPADGVCRRTGDDPRDGGLSDGGLPDGGGPDGGRADGGSPDGGGPDGGLLDGGAPDGGDACGGACAGSTPVCDPASGACVRCTATAGCDEGMRCDLSVSAGRCVGCLGDGDCAAPAPRCDSAEGRCVGCLSDGDCGAEAPVCDGSVLRCERCTPERGCGGTRPACDTAVPGGLCVQCTGDDDCGGATPVCDTASNTCIGCRDASDCGADAPVCDPGPRRCVACTAAAGCGGAAPVCDLSVAGGRCVECVSQAHCTGTAPRCDVAAGRCVGCTTDAQCGGSTPVCDGATSTCVACTAARGCSGATPVCDVSVAGGRCVQCVADGQCPARWPVCDRALAGGTCVECTANGHCGAASPICWASTAGGRCVQCTETAHCGGATPVCSLSGHLCVGCLSGSDCGPSAPVCDLGAKRCAVCTATAGCSGATPVCDTTTPGGRCVACTANEHCGGTTPYCDAASRTCVRCLADGQCPAAAPVCDPATKSCATCVAGRGCSETTPVCDTAAPGGRCVECVTGDHCTVAEPVCEALAAGGRCVECVTDAHCGGTVPACLAGETGGRCVECTGASHCGGSKPVCDPATHACVGCLGDGDCGPSAPVCDASVRRCVTCTAARGCSGAKPVCDVAVAGGRCVQCLLASQCGGATPLCDPAAGACVQCLADAQCPAATPVCDATKCVVCTAVRGCSGAKPVCDTAAAGGRCVQCTQASHCGGATPACEPASGACVRCTADGDCGGATPVCDTVAHACVRCVAGRGCAAPTPACDTSVSGGACVECLGSTDCAAPEPACDLPSRTCVECLGRSDCAAPEPVCDTAARACVECAANTDCADSEPVCDAAVCRGCQSHAECGAGRYCTAGAACATVPDTCASAQPLSFAAGATTLSFTADLSPAGDDSALGLEGSCNAAGGAELVYRLTLASAADVTVTAAPAAGSTANPVIYVRTLANCALGPLADLRCQNNATNPAATESVTLYNRTGDLALVVEAYGTTAGLVDVVVTLGPPTVQPANDECGGVVAVAFDAEGVARASGNTTLATNSSTDTTTPSCSSTAATSGRDVVFSYALPAAADVAIEAVAGTPATLDPVIYVRGEGRCASGLRADELGCTSSGGASTASLLLRNQAAGTYYLWVDGYMDSYGRFDATVRRLPPTLPPANDDCATARWLAFVNDTATDEGDTHLATNGNVSGDVSPTCSTTARLSGKDVVHAFHLSAARDVVVRVAGQGTTPIAPVVYVRPLADCAVGTPGAQLTCAAAASGGTATARLLRLPAGDYAVWVDSGSTSGGDYLLEVATTAPTPAPPNDTCAGMQTVTFDAAGVARATGDTAQAGNDTAADATPSCSTGARYVGRDVVLGLEVPAAADLSVVVVPDSTTYYPVASLRRPGQCASGDAAAEVGCDDATRAGGPASFEVAAAQLSAGTWPLIVDGASETGGTFTLHARLGPPPNDTCATARVVQRGVAVIDSTAFATDDYSRSSVPPYACGTYTFAGRDLVFVWTATEDGSVRATVRPDPTFDASLLRMAGACGPASCVQYRDSAGSGGFEELTFTAIAGETYWFAVDGYTATHSGGFVFRVE